MNQTRTHKHYHILPHSARNIVALRQVHCIADLEDRHSCYSILNQPQRKPALRMSARCLDSTSLAFVLRMLNHLGSSLEVCCTVEEDMSKKDYVEMV
jgi:hypothetical protein